jgi:hypothetical protein
MNRDVNVSGRLSAREERTEAWFKCNLVRRFLVTGLAVLWVLSTSAACETPGREYEESGPTPSTERYEPDGDPRHPRPPGTRSGLWFEQPRIRGPLSPTKVVDVALKDQSKAEACLGTSDPSAYPEGRLVVELLVGPKGKTEQASVFETSIYDRTFQRCLVDLAEGWRFPVTDVRETRVYLPVNVAPQRSSGSK